MKLPEDTKRRRHRRCGRFLCAGPVTADGDRVGAQWRQRMGPRAGLGHGIRASSLAVQLRRHLRLVRSEGCGTEHRLDARVLRRHAPIRGTRCLRELPWW